MGISPSGYTKWAPIRLRQNGCRAICGRQDADPQPIRARALHSGQAPTQTNLAPTSALYRENRALSSSQIEEHQTHTRHSTATTQHNQHVTQLMCHMCPTRCGTLFIVIQIFRWCIVRVSYRSACPGRDVPTVLSVLRHCLVSFIDLLEERRLPNEFGPRHRAAKSTRVISALERHAHTREKRSAAECRHAAVRHAAACCQPVGARCCTKGTGSGPSRPTAGKPSAARTRWRCL